MAKAPRLRVTLNGKTFETKPGAEIPYGPSTQETQQSWLIWCLVEQLGGKALVSLEEVSTARQCTYDVVANGDLLIEAKQ